MGTHENLMTTAEFASASGVPVKKIAAWLRQGTLKGAKTAGKWLIPADQLACLPALSAPAAAAPEAPAETADAGYSVEEFSALTYLTIFGVTDWLKKGLLKGRRDAGGNWRVDADNLGSDRIKRLRRF